MTDLKRSRVETEAQEMLHRHLPAPTSQVAWLQPFDTAANPVTETSAYQTYEAFLSPVEPNLRHSAAHQMSGAPIADVPYLPRKGGLSSQSPQASLKCAAIPEQDEEGYERS